MKISQFRVELKNCEIKMLRNMHLELNHEGSTQIAHQHLDNVHGRGYPISMLQLYVCACIDMQRLENIPMFWVRWYRIHG